MRQTAGIGGSRQADMLRAKQLRGILAGMIDSAESVVYEQGAVAGGRERLSFYQRVRERMLVQH